MAEVDAGSVSVIARQMNAIRDDFIAELFEEMKAEIQGLNHDARMMESGGRASPRTSWRLLTTWIAMSHQSC